MSSGFIGKNGDKCVENVDFWKKSKKGVDFLKKVRYNWGSLSKSVFPTSTKR